MSLDFLFIIFFFKILYFLTFYRVACCLTGPLYYVLTSIFAIQIFLVERKLQRITKLTASDLQRPPGLVGRLSL